MINREDIKVGLKFCLPTAVSDKPSMVCINVELYDGKIQTLEEHNNVDFTVEGVDKFLDREICCISYYCTDDDGEFDKTYYNVLLKDIMENGFRVIAESRTERSEGDDKTFRDIINGMYNTFKAKNHDYDNSFGELFDECGMTYAYGHLKEKVNRIGALRKDEAKVKGESMRDSLLDLANYAILTIMELDKTKK